jgi:hypothetical protein
VNKKAPLNSFFSLLLLSMLLATLYTTVPVHATLLWNIQTVDEYASSSGYGTAYPIAIDSKNITHIAYTAYTSLDHPWRAVYASWNGSSWDKQTVAEDSFVQCLALDANGNPHISCRGASMMRYTSTLLYATATTITQAASPTFPALPLLSASTAVVIGAIIITVYFKKRKH